MRSSTLKARSGCLCVLFLLGGLLGCASTSKQAQREENVKRARAHFDLAADHVANDRLELGLRELLMAERLDPRNPRIQHGLGIAYLQRGKVDLAEQHMLRAIEITPDYQEARFNLAALYLNFGRYEECVEHSRILADDPTFTSPWKAYNSWGWALYELGEVKEARLKLDRALELRPGYWPSLMNLGILAAEQGQRPDAIRYFTQVLEIEPGPSATAEANYRLAEIYVSLGRRRQAVGHLRTAVVKAPSDPWGKKSEEYLKLLR
ncbi:MAG: tetratricopeptide repeat protein [Myxococcota bacterium]|nr:tetratricopeptide repeat protein [Myxococcota bacterium]